MEVHAGDHSSGATEARRSFMNLKLAWLQSEILSRTNENKCFKLTGHQATGEEAGSPPGL